MNLRYATLIALLAAVAAGPLLAADDLWTDNATEATTAAVKDSKDLLINFTGSDWCGWCTKLDKEVFSKAAFTTAAPKHFVLLKLDFPRRRKLSDEMKKQNQEWMAKMGVQGFPTIVLADAKGRPYAKTGYRPGGSDAYVTHLDELRQKRVQRDEAFAKAAKAEGAEKAKALDAALSALDASFVSQAYGEVVDQIATLDADGKAGLKAKYEAIALKAKIAAAMQQKDLDGAIKLCDEALAKVGATGDTAQEFLWSKSYAYFVKKDRENAKKNLEAALAAAPKGPKAAQIKQVLQRVFKTEK